MGVEPTAAVTLESVDGGFAITAINLIFTAKVPGTDEAAFNDLGNKAKAGCPVSKALAAVPITLEVSFG